MAPSLVAGQIVIVWTAGRYAVGDVVMAHARGREVVKRVASIDGRQVELLGDNRHKSTDSRSYGPVPQTDIVGTLIWPRFKPLES